MAVATAAIIAGATIAAGGKLGTSALDFGKNEQEFQHQLALNKQQFGYDTQLKEQQYGYDSSLSAQNAQQELAKQQNQQEWEKMMSDTTHQREVADMKAAGINPALAGGGVSSTNAQAAAPSAQQAQQPTTNARQSAKQAKKELLTTLQTAYASGVIKQASAKLETLGEKLAKQPKNYNLKKQMDAYTMKIYSLLV